MVFAKWIIAVGGLVFLLLGAMHFRMTVADMKNPRKFAPAKDGLLEELQSTRMRFRKDLKSFWDSYIGFHFSHSIGVIFYACIVLYFALIRPDILSDYIIRVGIVVFGAAYVLLARWFWFIIPFLGALIGVSVIAIGMAMLYP
ncbi:LIC_13387 family protein [Hyphococcus sp.]|uniref:LIC_13387 family protein n=1 Tax=Hyphococcus sp. TaxID=2038636 RepID=UPI003CCBA270